MRKAAEALYDKSTHTCINAHKHYTYMYTDTCTHPLFQGSDPPPHCIYHTNVDSAPKLTMNTTSQRSKKIIGLKWELRGKQGEKQGLSFVFQKHQ